MTVPGRQRFIVMAAVLGFLTLGAAAAGHLFSSPGLLEAWRFSATILVSLAVGSLMLVTIGHLLANEWLDAVRDELEPASWTIGVLLILGLPLLGMALPDAGTVIPAAELTQQRLAWFAPGQLLFRLAAALAIWIAVAGFVAAYGESRLVSAIGLGLAAAASTIAVADWILLSRPFWWSGLFPFAFIVTQLGAGLALAFVANLIQRERSEEEDFRSLASGLLTLALLTLWVWFAQFLIAWFGNLPDAALWHLTRTEDEGGLLIAGAGSAYAAAALLLILFTRHRMVMLAASALMLGGYVAGMIWLLRPAGLGGASTLDFAVFGGLALLWLGWLALGQLFYDATHGSSGSSNQRRSTGASGGQSRTSPSPSV